MQAKVGKKKYVCKVTVKNKKRANSSSQKRRPTQTILLQKKGQYKLSGYIKTKDGNIIKGPFRFSVEDKSHCLYDVSVDVKTGKYTTYVYPGDL